MNGFDLAKDGFSVTGPLLDSVSIDRLIEATEGRDPGDARRQRNSGMYAVRNLLTLVPEVRALASSPVVRSIIEPVLGLGWRCVRGILFDKSPEANWKVAWHQDLSVAVERRLEVSGFGPWSVKAGVQHVQPPVEILENMLTVRLHLDDCGLDNGPLNVLPGSHALGVLDPASVEECRRARDPVACIVVAGAALVMRPLLLHASSSATRPRHRRVIHLEFSAGELPGGLKWAVA
jgi:hypothetical protein